MGCRNLLSGLNSSHRLETTVYTSLVSEIAASLRTTARFNMISDRNNMFGVKGEKCPGDYE